jgi:outer membrane protein TolC
VCAALDALKASESFLSQHARDLADRRRALRERTERLFHAGEAEYAELALARRDEVQARIALLDAELAVATGRVDLDAAAGALDAGPTAP